MHLMILGTRGIPARHGGFETFAQDLSLFLTSRNHTVTVYCQAQSDASAFADEWQGVQRVHIPSANSPVGTVSFDWAATRHSSARDGVVLTLGYNTGVFSLLYRLRHLPSVMNMDGIEWKREKWSFAQRSWLRLNEWAGARFANHLVADHPEIAAHLRSHTRAKKITVIPYGADAVNSASTELLAEFNLTSKGYNLLIARPEPENSILEIVRACSSPRLRVPLVVLGDYSQGRNYQRQVLGAAGENVKFVGAIFDREIVRAMRYHASAYIHGHRVGGTNPSLVESLAAGNAIIAHDNRFNRWVAGESQRFFKGSDDLVEILHSLEENAGQLSQMREASRLRHQEEFTQEKVLLAYESVLMRVAAGARVEVGEVPAQGPAGRWS
jgi:glycosyltransferase involved in cell wall biosynthesis